MLVIEWLEHHLLLCPVKSYTGIDCPGCGMQRAFILLLKGDFVASFLMHPAGIPIVFLLLFLPLHLKFHFRFGTKIIVITYFLIAALTLIHYILKWIHGDVF